MTPSDEKHPDLEQALDEAGDLCRPRGQGWNTLLERLPRRHPPTPPRTQQEPPDTGEGLPIPRETRTERPGPAPPPLPAKRRPRRVPRWGWWMAAAVAASLLTAVIAWQARRAGEGRNDRSGADEMPVARDAPIPAVKPVELAAGCRVTPVGNVAYQVVHPHRVQLDCGELFVEIDRTRSGNQPFIIETPAGEAWAMGTSFAVESRLLETGGPAPPAALHAVDTARNQPMTPRLPSISFLTKVLVFAGVVQLITSETTLEGGPGGQLEATNPRVVQAAHTASPIFWALRDPQVRQELALTQQQLLGIRRIGAELNAASREEWAGVMELDADQRPQKIQQIRQNTQRRLNVATRKVRDLLGPEKFDRLLLAQLRLRGVAVLQTEPAVQRLQFDDEQQRLIRQKTNAMNLKLRALYQQMQEVRDETFDEAMGVLPARADRRPQRNGGQRPAAVGAVGTASAVGSGPAGRRGHPAAGKNPAARSVAAGDPGTTGDTTGSHAPERDTERRKHAGRGAAEWKHTARR